MLRSEAILAFRRWLVRRRRRCHAFALQLRFDFHRRIQRWRKHLPPGIIRAILIILAVPLSLLPFFQFFRGTPHQLAAIKELEESVSEELLDEDSDWYQAWKASGYDQEIYMPTSSSSTTKLELATASVFKCGSHGGGVLQKVETDDEYNKVRAEFGDTTSVEAQLQALRSLGLQAEFRKDGDADTWWS